MLSNAKKLLLGNIGKMLEDVEILVGARTMGVLCSMREMLKMSSNVKKTSRVIGNFFQTMGGHWGRMEALEKGWGNTKQIVAKDVQGPPS